MVFTGANDGFFNMALDEALLLSCRDRDFPPVLRLYLWSQPAITIGYSQPVKKTVDVRRCGLKGVGLVRRITGGRAILHEDELTYSLCASAKYFPQLGHTTQETYRKLSMALLESLRLLGVDGEWTRPASNRDSRTDHSVCSLPCFASSSKYEVTVQGKKLVGSAQRRFLSRSDGEEKESFMQQGSIPIGDAGRSLADFLPERDSAEIVRQNLAERSTNIEKTLRRRPGLPEMISAIKSGFERFFSIQMEDSVISDEELHDASVLRETKYSRDEWNLRR